MVQQLPYYNSQHYFMLGKMFADYMDIKQPSVRVTLRARSSLELEEL